MKRLLSTLLVGLALQSSGSVLGQVSAVPSAMNFQGRLATPSGNPVPDGTYSVRFSLWDALTAGTEKYNKTIANVQVKNGTFAVKLDAFPASTFNGNLWLEIKIGADAALTPRTPLVTVPYAFKSDLALTVPDGSITNAKLAGGITADKFASNALNPLAWLLGGNSGVTSGFLGTTDTNPLEFRVNNHRAMRYSYAENTGTAQRSINMLGGSEVNRIEPGVVGATIAGGGWVSFTGTDYPNQVLGDFGTVGGGYNNTVGRSSATVGGGLGNTAVGNFATVGGGQYNLSSGSSATVGGGRNNTANQESASVGGGNYNAASGLYSTVGGGQDNHASGMYSTVAGGYSNTAAGQYSFAAGYGARANHDGAFVWRDDSSNANFTSTGINQFLIRAGGGVGINTNDPAGNALNIAGTAQMTGFKLPTNAGVGKILASDAAGIGTWGQLTAAGIADGTITAAKLAGGTLNPLAWLLGGNSGTNPASNFLGTTDAQAMVFKTNNRRAMQYQYAENTVYRSINVLGGSEINTIGAGVVGATIAGGGEDNFTGTDYPNQVLGDFGTVGGGLGNTANGFSAFVGGGQSNTASGGIATVGGGLGNTSSGDRATVGGGYQNTASGFIATVGGGQFNISNSDFATVAGGIYNSSSGFASIVGGGQSNTSSNEYAVVGGGLGNTANGSSATIGGGDYNTASGQATTIAGGAGNISSVVWATVGGGYNNSAGGKGATVAGGSSNVANGDYSFAAGLRAKANHTGTFVWADQGDPVTGEGNDFASTGINQFLIRAQGGVGINTTNPAGNALNVVGTAQMTGFRLPTGATLGAVLTSDASGVGTWGQLTASGIAAGTITADKFASNALNPLAWLLGGNSGVTSGFLGTTDTNPLEFRVNNRRAMRYSYAENTVNVVRSINVLGGSEVNNIAPGVVGATIAGGGFITFDNLYSFPNSVTGDFGTVGGGESNTTNGYAATVGGGSGNTASNFYATVAGGVLNTASGDASTVAGGQQNTAIGSFATVGGGRNNTALGNYSFAAGHRAKANHNGAFVWADSTLADFASTALDQFNVRASGGTRIFSNSGATTGVLLAAGGGSWSSASDRNLKTNFQNVDSLNVLERLAAMPLTTWNYKANTEIRHMGVMAQDFYAAFGGLGMDDKHIDTVDADGVAFAAIQGLYRKFKAMENDNAILKAQNAELATKLALLAAAVAQLQAKHP